MTSNASPANGQVGGANAADPAQSRKAFMAGLASTFGWALDLFVGGLGREHDDLEIGVPRDQFAGIVGALPGFEWDVVGGGRVWPYPEKADTMQAQRTKDQADFLHALPMMDRSRRSRLSGWLSQVHPDHPWLEVLSNTAP